MKMVDWDSMSEAGRAAFLRAQKRLKASTTSSFQGQLRSENEDDDGYDPYSDYMDALSRSEGALFEENPWD